MLSSNINEELEKAVSDADLDKVKALLDAGASANLMTQTESLLHKTCSIEITNELLSRGVQVDIKNVLNGNTPLHSAIERDKSMELIMILLAHGADVNAANKTGNTVLHFALQHHKGLELLTELLSREVDVNAVNNYGSSALHMALYSDLEIIRLLLRHGARINAANSRGNTPLYVAIHCGVGSVGVKLIETLVQHGADVNVVNKNRETPLHFALKLRKGAEIVKVLLRHGADISTSCKNGDTPLQHVLTDRRHYVLTENHLECAKLLVETALLTNFDHYYKEIMLDIKGYLYFERLSQHLEGCVREIRQMKADMLNDSFSLYDVVNKPNMYSVRVTSAITDRLIATKYPIYHDVVSPKANWYLERTILMNKLSELLIYTVTHVSDRERKIMLNFDSTYKIATYLGNDELANLTAAFDRYSTKTFL